MSIEGWAVHNGGHFYWVVYATRKAAECAHARSMGAEWRQCWRNGDRCVRVRMECVR